MARFAVLEHVWNGVHWDVLLEDGAVLKTWELSVEPVLGVATRATPKADHRLHYLDYEGEIGGGRGFVRQWDAGALVWRKQGPDAFIADLSGRRLVGTVEIKLVDADAWQFTILGGAGCV